MITSTGIRVGMVGAGWMGRQIAPDFAEHDTLDLVSVTGRDRERTAAFAAEHRLAAVSFDELVNGDVDLVYIASTHESHAHLAEQALIAGKPVLLEKAFTQTAAQAERLIAISQEREVFLMEAMWMRFNPVIRTVTQIIEDGLIGDPRGLIASFGFRVPQTSGHRLWNSQVGGGSLLDQAVYPLALSDLLFGDTHALSATGSTRGDDGADSGVDSEIALVLSHAGDRQSLFATSLRAPLPGTADISGTGGRIHIPHGFHWTDRATIFPGDADPWEIHIPTRGRGYLPMLDAVAHALDQGWTSHPLSSHDSTLRIMRNIDDARRQLSQPCGNARQLADGSLPATSTPLDTLPTPH